eukprot:4391103-Prymnesium_polylepis.1
MPALPGYGTGTSYQYHHDHVLCPRPSRYGFNLLANGAESNKYQPSVSPFGDSRPGCPSQGAPQQDLAAVGALHGFTVRIRCETARNS